LIAPKPILSKHSITHRLNYTGSPMFTVNNTRASKPAHDTQRFVHVRNFDTCGKEDRNDENQRQINKEQNDF